MTMTGLDVFDTTVQATLPWVKALQAELGWEDRHHVFQGLRATLHALRDRLTVDEAAHLGAQLPILLGGFYYESWRPARNPRKDRTKAEFLSHVKEYFTRIDPDLEVETLVRAVFKVLSQRVTAGEIADILGMLPPELRELWPATVQT